ncbi:hypothetical protein ACE1CI_37850 [Aerosakkonemataceae cyanobacterium BLCC-F50]|uniref:Uncharacterized protein n=1 Tax=Floridaenema flaviceps BLCC-F50 TaxID=3153642 RepID=A0ABV4Y6I5_9CYAN
MKAVYLVCSQLVDTAGQAEIQACGETVRLAGTCTKKRVSEKQESPATPLERLAVRVSILNS